MVNFKNGEAPYLSAENLNKMQTDLQAPIGSIEINNGTDPSTYFEGIWEKQKLFLGGELIAFGNVKNGSTNTTSIADGKVFAISDSQIPSKIYNVTNYIDGILESSAGTLLVKPQNIVGMIEAEFCISGLGQNGLAGLWFKGNQNTLPEGVTLEVGDGPILSMANTYSGTINKYTYKIDEEKVFDDDESFYINPGVAPYSGSFIPTSGGTKCYLNVKVFAKKGATIWKRIS